MHVDVDPIAPVHEYPVSIVHVLLHPSPFTTLLSSQFSEESLIPSPQTTKHTSVEVVLPPVHDQPVTGPVQSDLQPEVLSVSPSSHTSEPYNRPSPQIELHEEVDPTAPVHEYPVSVVHVLLHPSPFATSLSSHASLDNLIPSPQIGEQVSAVVVVPPDHDQPVTGSVQSLFHPNVLSVSPSSHTSEPTLKPSPQTGVHVDVDPIVPVHEYPVSIVHVLLHPSPFTTLLSSQFSEESLIPSPQTTEHTSVVVVLPPEHDQPVTGPDQSAFQPEVLSVSLSSHTSEPYKRPSPQIELHEEVDPTAPVHEYPVSVVHVLLHPSPFAILLSSHTSLDNLMPSPQMGDHVSAVVVVPPEHDQPVTGPVQSDLQPEVLSTSPSSHTSDPCNNPLPQIGLHVDVDPTAPVHENPVSLVQVLLHPSLLTTLLSSQFFGRKTNSISSYCVANISCGSCSSRT